MPSKHPRLLPPIPIPVAARPRLRDLESGEYSTQNLSAQASSTSLALPEPVLRSPFLDSEHGSRYPSPAPSQLNPFEDGGAESVYDLPPELFSADEKYVPYGENLIVFPHQVEADDELHDPGVDAAARLRISWRGAAGIGGLVLVVAGVLALLLGWPMV